MSFCISNINAISIDDSGPGGSCFTASSSNITITRGTTFNLIFDLAYNTTETDGTITSEPADLNGYSINGVIRESSSSTTNILFMSTQNRMITIDYDTARVSISIPVKHTNRLPLGSQYYFFRLINSTGNTQKILQGIATISDSSV